MSIKQLRLKTKNISGNLSHLSDVLGEQGVNIRAILVGQYTGAGDSAEVCIVTDDPKKAKDALEAQDISFEETDVLAVEMPDHPGGMNAVLRPMKDAGINILSLYPYIGRATNPIIIMEVDHIKKAKDVLKRNWVKIWDKSIYKL